MVPPDSINRTSTRVAPAWRMTFVSASWKMRKNAVLRSWFQSDALAHGLGLALQRLEPLRQPARQPGQLQLQSGQRLSQFVVDLPVDARAFGFAHMLQMD